ncbi:MAG: ABC transporter permease [Muribaculaceae bacterium]|nr:ABC transporter permease [Muribaculaceae bacterium]
MTKTSSRNTLVRRLLRRNISAGQLIGFALANLVGLSIVLVAMQFYRDVTAVWSDDDSFISRDFMIISRHVSGINFNDRGSTTFSNTDIAEIESQPWARRVGRFTAAGFNVYASLEMGGSGIGTALFLESIPSSFFDDLPGGWNFTPGQNKPLPVIISKDYLTLYNFGFASSRGLPQISEKMIGMVPLKLSVSGNGVQQYIDARVVGFSSRLNTIAVPEEFMTWANSRFAEPGKTADPSRLIIELSTPGDPAATAFMESHNYEVAGDRIDNSRAAFFLGLVTSVVIVVGIVISLLAFFILLLSIYLLLQKNRKKIHELMQLGYLPSDISRHYNLLVLTVNAAVLVIAAAGVTFCAGLWQQPLASIGVSGSPVWPTILVGACIIGAITAGSVVAINRRVKSVFRL